ncbi:hypothetical protein EXIGLDRAFT_137219 [Exidia glandulosa HHB12029]|uniref:Uncharacterized protein n=1 Tax=Exidia glandulosa HHB12029 TaxID=1314781 RepID=A0A165G1X8_EXIGL|nr:hypothetical protein EXIGLDRAFT_137219 [Exidia glandulosa HHB12029]
MWRCYSHAFPRKYIVADKYTTSANTRPELSNVSCLLTVHHLYVQLRRRRLSGRSTLAIDTDRQSSASALQASLRTPTPTIG